MFDLNSLHVVDDPLVREAHSINVQPGHVLPLDVVEVFFGQFFVVECKDLVICKV